MKRNLVVAAVAALAVSACASNPEEIGPGSSAPPLPAASPGAGDGTIEQFKQVAGDTVFFGFDSFALTSEARDTLAKQAEWLQRYSNVTIRIEGNCDERGTREYNLALGERRASAARDYLVNLGVAPSRITVVSYGKERPRDPRSNEAAWAVNRNATTVILSGAVG